jgi:uncharacterized membrane protein YeiH
MDWLGVPSLGAALLAIEAAATIAFALSGLLEAARKRLDAAGPGLFTASGTQIALDMGSPMIVAVLMGVITAVFGGVLRDIVCNELPRAFSDHRPYAICAFIGGWVLVACHALSVPDQLGLVVAALVTALLRGVALATEFTLPRWSRRDHD